MQLAVKRPTTAVQTIHSRNTSVRGAEPQDQDGTALPPTREKKLMGPKSSRIAKSGLDR